MSTFASSVEQEKKSVYTIKIELLRSFKDLKTQDQNICLQLYRKALKNPNPSIVHKYMKYTDEIATRSAKFGEAHKPCFLSFDRITIANRFAILVFLLNGICVRYSYVLYYCVIDLYGKTFDELPKFICNLLVNLLTDDVPQLKKISLKFVMYRYNSICHHAVTIMQRSLDTREVYDRFIFVPDPHELKSEHGFNKYVLVAISDILYKKLEKSNIQDIFEPYITRFAAKPEDINLKQYIQNFFKVGNSILKDGTITEVYLTLCSLEALGHFMYVIYTNLQIFDPEDFCRSLIFTCILAVIIIFEK